METQKEQPLELLKREDVRTMAKDIALLREGEARVERGRVGELEKPQPVQSRSAQKPGQTSDVQEVPPTPTSDVSSDVSLMPKRKAGMGKLFIRILLVLIILFVIMNAIALAFFLLSKDKKGQAPSPRPSPVAPEPLRVPSPLFPIALAEQVSLGKNGNLAETLEQTLQRERSAGLTRIVLAAPEENRVWNAKEFLSSLSVTSPEGVADSLQENLTLFVHKNAQNRSRLGFAIPLAENAHIEADLTAWEP
ncbi:MAG: hypothetical protein HYW96_00685, partial [Candidatus Wildermuthbacteria bacterium]|nr:hypothetical protein [Candidatus Wildermuthbacteria bacterium]